MRVKAESKMISVSKEVYDQLIKDRADFQKLIGGGKWSISDTINEYYKIMRLKNDKKTATERNDQSESGMEETLMDTSRR